MSTRTFKNSKVHQKRCGVRAHHNGEGGTRTELMWAEEPKWHWSNSATLVALEAKLAQIRLQIPQETTTTP